MNNLRTDFYLCTMCFNTSETPRICHNRPMAHYPGHRADHLKPPIDENGRLRNRAPLWFINATQHAPLLTMSAN
jgi:hypothetical protein